MSSTATCEDPTCWLTMTGTLCLRTLGSQFSLTRRRPPTRRTTVDRFDGWVLNCTTRSPAAWRTLHGLLLAIVIASHSFALRCVPRCKSTDKTSMHLPYIALYWEAAVQRHLPRCGGHAARYGERATGKALRRGGSGTDVRRAMDNRPAVLVARGGRAAQHGARGGDDAGCQ